MNKLLLLLGLIFYFNPIVDAFKSYAKHGIELDTNFRLNLMSVGSVWNIISPGRMKFGFSDSNYSVADEAYRTDTNIYSTPGSSLCNMPLAINYVYRLQKNIALKFGLQTIIYSSGYVHKKEYELPILKAALADPTTQVIRKGRQGEKISCNFDIAAKFGYFTTYNNTTFGYQAMLGRQNGGKSWFLADDIGGQIKDSKDFTSYYGGIGIQVGRNINKNLNLNISLMGIWGLAKTTHLRLDGGTHVTWKHNIRGVRLGVGGILKFVIV